MLCPFPLEKLNFLLVETKFFKPNNFINSYSKKYFDNEKLNLYHAYVIDTWFLS